MVPCLVLITYWVELQAASNVKAQVLRIMVAFIAIPFDLMASNYPRRVRSFGPHFNLSFGRAGHAELWWSAGALPPRIRIGYAIGLNSL
jgi:hypothetical protein